METHITFTHHTHLYTLTHVHVNDNFINIFSKMKATYKSNFFKMKTKLISNLVFGVTLYVCKKLKNKSRFFARERNAWISSLVSRLYEYRWLFLDCYYTITDSIQFFSIKEFSLIIFISIIIFLLFFFNLTIKDIFVIIFVQK